MAISRDAQDIVKAINANTRAIENLGKAFDKLARAPRPQFSIDNPPAPIDLEKVEHDYDGNTQ